MSTNGSASARDTVVAELRAARKLLIVTHENPDGDALGSLIAMQRILTQLGKDAVGTAREQPALHVVGRRRQ